MEHVIQIGVSVDDEAIQRQIIASAETKIVTEIKSQVEETIFHRRNYYGSTRTELSEVGAHYAVSKSLIYIDQGATEGY